MLKVNEVCKSFCKLSMESRLCKFYYLWSR